MPKKLTYFFTRNVPSSKGLRGTWPDRQGTGKAACASVACSAFALAGMLDPVLEYYNILENILEY